MTIKKIFFLFVGLIFFLSSCGYKFYDASIPPEVKTIRINPFVNTATLVNPLLTVSATTKFIDKIQSQTKLFVVNKGKADYEVSGNITNYGTSLSNINQSNPGAAPRSFLNITINYSFVNNLEAILPDIKNADYSLTVSEEFDGRENLATAEQRLLANLLDQITNQAFNKMFSSW